MSSTEAPISITVKTAAGSLVTVRAESSEELDSIVALALPSVTSAVTELEAAVRGVTPASAVSTAATTIAQQLGGQVISTPAYTPAPLGGGGRQCPHGKMTAIQGASKQGGGVYKGYFCASAQGDPSKCKTIYLDAKSPDWGTFVPERIK